jgi:hypothetical protein
MAMLTIFTAGVWAGVGGAGQGVESATTLGLTARLNAAQEVPKPKGVSTLARGSFAGGLVRVGTGGRLSWRLTFQRLTGRALAAHIHFGKRGRAGAVAVALCGPCRSGVRGIKTVNARTVKALLNGGAYVNVHTARNPAGEIRGQITRTATPPPPPPTTTATTTTTPTTTGTTTYDYP